VAIQAIIGIDPGKTGAIALLHGCGCVFASLVDTSDAGALLSVLSLVHVAAGAGAVSEPPVCAIEAVHSMPGQGVASTFAFGESVGVCRGVAEALGMDVVRVRPREWHAVALVGVDTPWRGWKVNTDGFLPARKKAAEAAMAAKKRKARKTAVLEAARLRWPDVGLNRVKDGAIADALWIAETVRLGGE